MKNISKKKSTLFEGFASLTSSILLYLKRNNAKALTIPSISKVGKV